MYTLKLMTNISCCMILAGLVPAANAAQVNGKLQVKVNIGAACELKSGDKSVLDFGSLNNLNDKDHDEQTAASTGIEIQCSKGIAYKIGLGYGLNPSNSLNCPPFRPDSRHKQKGSSTGLGIGLCLTSIDTLNC